MPTITLNRKEVEQHLGKTLSTEKLAERIMMLGTDLDNLTKEEIIVEVFANRPDMLSEQGFTRALSSFVGEKTGLQKYTVKKSGKKVFVDKTVTMRPFTACAIVKNMKFTHDRIKAVMNAQEKLATTHGRNRKKSAYGLYPLETITFPIHYIAKDPEKVQFQALGFDKKMTGKQVESLHPTGKAYKHVTEGWKQYPFFIDAKENILSMLPYTNSHDTGKITEKTREVFIECTGTDSDNVSVALNMFCSMLADMGGKIYSLDVQYHNKKITTPDLEPTKMKVDREYINKRLGVTFSEKEMKKNLERMGYGYEKGYALIPAYRADIMHQVDLMEDIAIAYGYENFIPIIPNVSTIGEEDACEILKRKVSDILVGLGLLELHTYNLTSKELQTIKMNTTIDTVELENALSEEANTPRVWVIPSVLNVLGNNKHHEYPQNVFTIGRVFKKSSSSETGVKEKDHLVIALCHEKADYTSVRQTLDYLGRMIDKTFTVKAEDHNSFIQGRAGMILLGKTEAGIIGEIHPEVLKNFDIIMPVSVIEFDLSIL